MAAARHSAVYLSIAFAQQGGFVLGSGRTVAAAKDPRGAVRVDEEAAETRGVDQAHAPSLPVRRLAAVAALVALVVGVALSARGMPSPSRAEDLRVGQFVTQPQGRRGAPVDLVGRTLAGGRVDLAMWRGSIVVVNVWASWCSPCRKEAPALGAAFRTLQPDSVMFVGIDSRDNLRSARNFVAEFQLSYPSIQDTGTSLLAFRGAVPPAALPTTLILDRRGRVAGRFSGTIDERTLVNMVGKIAAEGSSA